MSEGGGVALRRPEGDRALVGVRSILLVGMAPDHGAQYQDEGESDYDQSAILTRNSCLRRGLGRARWRRGSCHTGEGDVVGFKAATMTFMCVPLGGTKGRAKRRALPRPFAT